ncbi:MAG TPA: hypothetical protein VHN77_05125 [Phycisphaerales bacterium]|nr:hypothetical protein [Phycisphaerales bacterium]
MIPSAALGAFAVATSALLPCPAHAEGDPVPLTDGHVPTIVQWASPVSLTHERSTAGVVIRHDLTLAGAAWVRPHLVGSVLPPGTALHISALADGAEQTFDGAMLDAWGGCGAYFNGDTLRFEVVSSAPLAAGAARLQITAVEVSPPFDARGGPGEIGMCGSDDRQPSTEAWVARLMPAMCSASIICSNSTAISAGHCAQGSMVLQFRVPPSLVNCTLVMPPPEDQFPATLVTAQSGGVGADWSVFTTGTNTLGQTAFGRMGTYGLISSGPIPAGSPAAVIGYGQDLTCVRNSTQQTSPGSVSSASATTVVHSCDIRVGSSGSPVVVNGRVVGVATHANGCSNIATSVRSTAFASAIAARTCPTGCDTVDFNRDALFPDTLDVAEFLNAFSGGACSNDPGCGDLDFNNDGLFPDTQDIASLLSVFSGGACL